MILDLFSYFAKFPSKSGVLSIFTNGSSTYAQYSELHNVITNLPEPLVPAIQSYVFGQSFESVKARIDNLTGTYLFPRAITGILSKILKSWRLLLQ